MKNIVLSLIFLAAMNVSLFAESDEELRQLFPANVASAIREKGFLQHSAYREEGANLSLVPDIDIVRNSSEIESVPRVPFFVESLYLYKKPAGKVSSPGEDISRISVILRSLSRLEGIEYYSSSRKKMRTLYEKSYAVDNAKSRNRIADPVDGSADGKSVLVLQKDLTFGEYIYRYSYKQTNTSVGFFSTNSEAMSYSFIKLIDPEKLKTILVVHDMGDSLLVYGLTIAVFPSIPGLEGKLNSSFSTRADAVYKWFVSEYER